jgi:hypothetical protein
MIGFVVLNSDLSAHSKEGVVRKGFKDEKN